MTLDPRELLRRRKALLQRVDDAIRAEQWSRAVLLTDKGLRQAEHAPAHPDLLLRRSKAQRKLGAAWTGAALSSLREGIRLAKKQPLKARFLVALAHFYALQCDWPALELEVLPTLLKFKESRNKQVQYQVVWTLFYMACCRENQFEYAKAQALYEEALERSEAFAELHPALPHILLNLSGALLYGGDPAAALPWLEQAEPLQPDDGYRESRWAEYYLAVGDDAAASEWITRTITHPNAQADHGLHANGRFVWAQLRQRKGDLVGAREQAHLALELAYRAIDYPLIQQLTTLLRDLEEPPPGNGPIH